MVAPNENTPLEPAQLALFADTVGMDLNEIPEGVSEMTGQELQFIQGYLSHGQAGKAAREAGYGNTARSASTRATALLRKPRVVNMIRRMMKPLAANGERIIERQTMQSLRMHDQAIEWGERVSEKYEEKERSKKRWRKDVENAELKEDYHFNRNEYLDAVRLEQVYLKKAIEVDGLLGQLLQKIDITVNVNAVNMHLGNDVLARLHRARQRVLARAEAIEAEVSE